MTRKQQYPSFGDAAPPKGGRFSLARGGQLQPLYGRRKPVTLRPLGKGQFARAFVTTSLKTPYVLSFVESDSRDQTKEIYALICQYASRRDKHLPCMERVGWYESGRKGYTIFAMPLYRAPLRKTTAPKAYAQAKVLAKCLEEAWAIHRRKHGGSTGASIRDMYYDSQSLNQQVVKCARRNKLPGALVSSLKTLADESVNFGATYVFEFPMRNMGSDDKGNLILFDVIFDGYENYLSAMRKQKLRRGW